MGSSTVAEPRLEPEIRNALFGQVPTDAPWASVVIENCGGKGDSAHTMSPFSGRFTNNSVPSLQAELRLYPTTTMPFGTFASLQMTDGGDGLRVRRADF